MPRKGDNMAEMRNLTNDAGFLTLSMIRSDGTVTETTEKQYRDILTEFLQFTGKPFVKTGGNDVLRYRTDLTMRNWRTSTIRKHLASLHSVFEHMLQRRDLLSLSGEEIPLNPFTPYLIKDETDEVDPRNVAPVAGVQKLLSVNEDASVSCAVLLCLKLLLHIRELVAIRTSDLFQSEYEGEKVLALHVGKGPTERDMLVPSDMKDFLVHVRNKANENKNNTEGFLLCNETTGKPLSAATLRMRLWRAIQKYSLPDNINFNSIRNLGIALCRAPEDVLFNHLSFADDRHNRRVIVLRKMGDKVCAAGEKVDVSVTLKGL